MRQKDRNPKFQQTPPGKTPRLGTNPEDANKQTPVWSVSKFDHDGIWGKDKFGDHTIIWDELLPKLSSYETMTWNDIYRNKKRDHSVEVWKLIKEARDRLAELKLDETEELFRFRLSGTGRLWGIRNGRVFILLWWDPDHEICPSGE
jgi:hypothetical protein